ncbi:MAG: hypothetical protein ABWY20_20265 [Mycobacterium sp.]
MTTPVPYKSDRWITPGVVVTLIIAVTIGLLAVVTAAAWLTSLGKDPGPMYDFVTGAIGGLTGSASLVLQLANRKTATKTERNTGALLNHTGDLTNAVYEVADAMPRIRPPARHVDPDDTAYMGAAPGPRGS